MDTFGKWKSMEDRFQEAQTADSTPGLYSTLGTSTCQSAGVSIWPAISVRTSDVHPCRERPHLTCSEGKQSMHPETAGSQDPGSSPPSLEELHSQWKSCDPGADLALPPQPLKWRWGSAEVIHLRIPDTLLRAMMVDADVPQS
ncbi:hypothetical protein GN956_G9989 [Arapaima gigas]